jgi:16S rRNA (guanine966-N2)-methyltransferase
MTPRSLEPLWGLPMRIISGTLKGKKLLTPGRGSLRPTSDRVKESMFNILGKEVEEKVVLDLFSGTGNLGIEALSRGAKRVTFVENTRQAYRLIERNLLECRMEGRSEILLKEADRGLKLLRERAECFDLIFMDPPYEKGFVGKTVEILGVVKIYHQDSLLVIEHTRREPLPELSGSWHLARQRRIGDTVLSFLTPVIRSGSDQGRLNTKEDAKNDEKGI